jgi:hypothetical protein
VAGGGGRGGVGDCGEERHGGAGGEGRRKGLGF